jgi:hypothetical protein
LHYLIYFSNLHIKHQMIHNVHLMINYIKKDNEKYKNNVMKNKFSKYYFWMLKKIGCSLNFLRWSIRWSLTIRDVNHLVAIWCFLVVPLKIQDQDHLVATRFLSEKKEKKEFMTIKSFFVFFCLET